MRIRFNQFAKSLLATFIVFVATVNVLMLQLAIAGRVKYSFSKCYSPKVLQKFCENEGFDVFELAGRGKNYCYVVCGQRSEPVSQIKGAIQLSGTILHDLNKVLNVSTAICQSATLYEESESQKIEREFRELLEESSTYEKYHSNYTKSTIRGIYDLFRKRNQIALIQNENERNKKIIELTGLTAEDGFCRGTDRDVILKCLKDKVNLLLDSFNQAKANEKLKEFFKEAFQSDPCFNGRMIALEDYAAKKLYGISEEALEDPKAPALLGQKYYELLNEVDANQNTTLSEFKNLLKVKFPDRYIKELSPEMESQDFIRVFNHAKLGLI